MITLSVNAIQYEQNKMLGYRREIALQGALVMAKSGRLELSSGNILRTSSATVTDVLTDVLLIT